MNKIWLVLQNPNQKGGIETFANDLELALKVNYRVGYIYLHADTWLLSDKKIILKSNSSFLIRKIILKILVRKKDRIIFHQPGHLKYYSRNSLNTYLFIHNPSDISKFQILNSLEKVILFPVAEHIKNYLNDFCNRKYVILPPIHKCNHKISEEFSFNFIYVGRFDHPKRIDLILTWVLKLSILFPQIFINLTFVGRGVNEKLILHFANNLISKNIKIFLHEWMPREELCRLFHINSFYIQLSEIEGMPIALREAMSAGLIPLVSDIPAHLEIVHHSYNGFVITDKFCFNEFYSIVTNSSKRFQLINKAVSSVSSHTFFNFQNNILNKI